MTPDLLALSRADLDWTQDLGSIWRDAPGHVPALHAEVADVIAADFTALSPPRAAPPLGRVIQGGQGTGKTHLLGTLRRQVWDAAGWFVMLEPAGATPFWDSAALGFATALDRPLPDGGTQGDLLLARLMSGSSRPPGWLSWLPRRSRSPRVEGLLAAVQGLDPGGAAQHRDVVAAVAQLRLGEGDAPGLAHAWLRGIELDPEQRRATSIMRPGAVPRDTVAGLSWLLALAAPTMCVVDQIDAVVGAADAHSQATPRFHDLAQGLMDLRDVTRRTMIVVSTLERTWDRLLRNSVTSFPGRFRDPIQLKPISQPTVACELVAARLAQAYRTAGITPPYPSWPFHTAAFVGAVQLTPRELFRRCRTHVDICIARGRVIELTSFEAAVWEPTPPGPLDDIRARYAQLCARTHDIDTYDQPLMSSLVSAALRAWFGQHAPEEQDRIELHLGAQALAADVARPGLRVSFHVSTGTAYRTIQAELADAQTASGIGRAGSPAARLVLVRAHPWPTGAKTADMLRGIEAAGGLRLSPSFDELRRFDALRLLFDERPPALAEWLHADQPLQDSAFLRLALAPPDAVRAPPPRPPAPHPMPSAPTAATPALLPLGRRAGDSAPVGLPSLSLAKHVAVLAGTGSGKTVLLRRLAEEAVLAGIPSILIDSNNDLVRMADPWPDPERSLGPEDAAQAARYFARADVVVWTPGRAQGNPITLSLLPDFAAIRADPDELEDALDMAMANLEPLVIPRVASANVQSGLLKDVLRHFARAGGAGLPALIDLLRDLPPEASPISRAQKYAADVADRLLSAMSLNRLLTADGPPLDPGRLLAGETGRVRVSVVNLAGLATPEARQDFVGRLMMALYSHIRAHPSDGCGSLLVMDEAHLFVPSQKSTASKAAAIGLVRQARKYGLGLVFASQEPRGLDTKITQNCATKLIGKMNSPATIEAARDILSAAGGDGPDIGRLSHGQFYAALDGAGAPVKLQAPLCLSHHPPSPPPEDEVLARAARTRLAA